MRNCLLHFPLVNKVADITDVHVCSAPQRSKREGIFQTSITSPLKSMDLFLKHFRWQRRVPWTKALSVRRVAQSSGCVHSQLTPLLSGLPDWFGTAWMGKAESWAGAATAISTHMYLWVLRLKVCLVMFLYIILMQMTGDFLVFPKHSPHHFQLSPQQTVGIFPWCENEEDKHKRNTFQVF